MLLRESGNKSKWLIGLLPSLLERLRGMAHFKYSPSIQLLRYRYAEQRNIDLNSTVNLR